MYRTSYATNNEEEFNYGDNGILTETSTKHTHAARLGYIRLTRRKGAPPAAIRLLIKLERIPREKIGFSTLLQYRSERKLRSAPCTIVLIHADDSKFPLTAVVLGIV